jgi:hypothetical protein
MKEKTIETNIYNYLVELWAVVEKMQWWKILIKKWAYNHMMTLQTTWCPDIMCYYKWNFIAIEVKKNEKEVFKWCKLKDRYLQWETLPISYKRSLNQIKYREKVLNNWGVFIITWELEEIVDYFLNL